MEVATTGGGGGAGNRVYIDGRVTSVVLTGSFFDYQLMCGATTGLPQGVLTYQGA